MPSSVHEVIIKNLIPHWQPFSKNSTNEEIVNNLLINIQTNVSRLFNRHKNWVRHQSYI